jgi:hypothetical protein
MNRRGQTVRLFSWLYQMIRLLFVKNSDRSCHKVVGYSVNVAW